MLISSALIVFKHPVYLLWTHVFHVRNCWCIICWLFLFSCTWKHRQNTHSNCRYLKSRCPIWVQCWKTNISIWVDVFVIGRFTDENNFRRINRIFIIKLKLQCESFSLIKGSLCALKSHMPHHIWFILNVQLKNTLKILSDIFSFFFKTT